MKACHTSRMVEMLSKAFVIAASGSLRTWTLLPNPAALAHERVRSLALSVQMAGTVKVYSMQAF
jgi:hypothetical protein